METSRSISQSNIITKCGNYFTHLLSAPWSSWMRVALTSMISWSTSNLLDAHLLCQAGQVVQVLSLKIKTSSIEAWSNKRFRAGVFVGLVALPAWKCHQFFDINARDYNWYFLNWVFYLHDIRPYIVGFFLATGLFIGCPQKWSFRWFALPIAVFCVTEIYQISGYTDWTHFHQEMPSWQYWLLVLVTIPPVLFSMNYLLYRKYHLKDGNTCRMVGVIEMDLPWEKKEEILKGLAKEFRDYNNRV
jgi:hypothetical protein